MLKRISQTQQRLKVGSHGEDYGSWMSNPVFYLFGGLTLIAAVLAVICSALCYYLYGNALYEMSPLASAIFINLIPLTTIVGGVVLLGESLTWLTVAVGAMIIGSIFLVNMAEAKA